MPNFGPRSSTSPNLGASLVWRNSVLGPTRACVSLVYGLDLSIKPFTKASALGLEGFCVSVRHSGLTPSAMWLLDGPNDGKFALPFCHWALSRSASYSTSPLDHAFSF